MGPSRQDRRLSYTNPEVVVLPSGAVQLIIYGRATNIGSMNTGVSCGLEAGLIIATPRLQRLVSPSVSDIGNRNDWTIRVAETPASNGVRDDIRVRVYRRGEPQTCE